MAENMKFVVKMLTGREVQVQVNKTGKIWDVKEYIYRNTGEACSKYGMLGHAQLILRMAERPMCRF